MFRGIKSVTIDAKGRIMLPACYRDLLAADKTAEMEKDKEDKNKKGKGSAVVVTIDTESPCLLLYPAREWELIEEKLQALPSFNPAARRIQRLLIGHATDLELDSNGRILLPELLREYSQIKDLKAPKDTEKKEEGKEVMLVGQGKKIELWSASEWNRRRDEWIKEAKAINPGDLPDELQSLAL